MAVGVVVRRVRWGRGAKMGLLLSNQHLDQTAQRDGLLSSASGRLSCLVPELPE